MSQTCGNVVVHLIFSTKQRQPLVTSTFSFAPAGLHLLLLLTQGEGEKHALRPGL
jgi:hypothetical protein